MGAVTIDIQEGSVSLLTEIEQSLNGHNDIKKLLFRSMLMPILDRHLSDTLKHKILADWHMEIHYDLKHDWEQKYGKTLDEEDFREDR